MGRVKSRLYAKLNFITNFTKIITFVTRLLMGNMSAHIHTHNHNINDFLLMKYGKQDKDKTAAWETCAEFDSFGEITLRNTQGVANTSGWYDKGFSRKGIS
jgi:hypothetical protein